MNIQLKRLAGADESCSVVRLPVTMIFSATISSRGQSLQIDGKPAQETSAVGLPRVAVLYNQTDKVSSLCHAMSR